ncbi:50S ribosomal protein L7/L12 [bacterium]|nr:50S ribosomal protein L7/L12 [bacterium]
MAANNEKLIEQIGSMTVLELSGLVDELKKKFNISDVVMASGPAAGGSEVAAKSEEKSEYKVTLKESGPEKIKTIKALRQVITTLGLPEAKKAVEEAPTVLAESAPKADALKMKEVLEAAGAKVELS